MNLEVVKFINCIIFAFMNVFLIHSLGSKDDLVKFTVKRLLCVSITSIVLIIAANYLVPLPFKMATIIIMTFILCQLIYKTSFVKKLLRSIIVISINGIIETVLSFILVVIFKFDMAYIMENIFYYILYNLSNVLIIITIAILFKMKNGRIIFAGKNMSKFSQILLFTIILFQFIRICVEFFIWYYVAVIPNLQYISIISYMCSIFSIGLLLYSTNIIIDKENIIKISKEYSENLSVYNEVLQGSIEKQRKVAHEHGNQLAVLSGYISSGMIEKAEQYLSKLVGTINIDNEYLNHITESGLKALMIFKVAMMERKNIELEVVIDEYIDDTIIPSEDVCNIMGVFLDNAIDAASQCDEPYISLSIFKNEQGLIILVMNSVDDVNIDTEKIFKKGYSSKGEGRGFGLHIVDEIVQKYEELELFTRVEDRLFIQELNISYKSTFSIEL